LKKAEHFSWTPEAEEALDSLKKMLTSAPVLVPSQPVEPMLLYVTATTQVVRAAVVVERQEEGHALPVQRPVYFISEVLSETKVRYPQNQKLIYAVELMSETLTYAPRKAIKSQALADFIVEWTDSQLPPAQVQAELWKMYFDGSLMKTGAGSGLLLISPLGVHMRYVIRIHFAASNNVTDYEALINRLKIAIELGVWCLDVRGNSQLVIDQVMKASSCHDPKMEAYCKEVRRLEDKFHGLELVHIARRYNEAADELAKIASTRGTVPPDAFLRDLHEPSVDLSSGADVETIAPIQLTLSKPCWRQQK